MKTVGQLVHSLNIDEVLVALHNNYKIPLEDEAKYRSMWAELQRLKPKPTTTTVYINLRKYIDTEDFYIDVSGLEPNDTEFYGLDFLEWEKWLFMPIKVDTALLPMLETYQMAHCLHEMSVVGYTQEVIKGVVQDIKNNIDEINRQISCLGRGVN